MHVAGCIRVGHEFNFGGVEAESGKRDSGSDIRVLRIEQRRFAGGAAIQHRAAGQLVEIGDFLRR